MLKWLVIFLLITVGGYNTSTIREPIAPYDGLTDAVCSESVTTVSGSYAPQGPICANRLLFSEEFDNGFNMDLWMHEVNMNGGGNGEFHWYVNDRRNSFVENGKLIIRPTLTTDNIPDLNNCHIVLDPCNTWEGTRDGCEHVCSYDHPAPPIRSALVQTKNTFAFKYGRIEIRAKPPTGDWLWPALWMMPKVETFGGWPRSGEIDLFEYRGNEHLYDYNGHNIGVEDFGSTLHFGNLPLQSVRSFFNRRSTPGWGFNREFHNYQMEWTPSYLSFSVDNSWIGTIPAGDGFHARGEFEGPNIWTDGDIMAPFDQEFYFIINLAIGGTSGYFPDEGNISGKPWRNDSPTPIRDFWNGRDTWLPTWKLHSNQGRDAAFQIEYVRMWSL